MMENRIAEALSVLLEQKVPPGGDIQMATCVAWDSVKHIEIIMTLEDLFAISFAPEDIPALTSQRRLAAAIQQLLKE
jgi:acyl carrier protein